MKKLLIALFVLAISLPSFAKLKEKDVVGTWKYTVEVEGMVLTGVMVFEKKDGKLTGKVIADTGETYPLNNIEIKENNILYFELEPEYEVMKITLTVDGKTFSGGVGTYDGEVPITGKKVE